MIQLRNYQLQLIESVLDAIKKRKSKILLMAPTGSGKTVMALELLRRWAEHGNRCLFTCHRKNLVNQTYAKFEHLSPSVIMADDDRFNEHSRIQIASLYTLKNREFDPPQYVIMDEVHYGYDSDLIQELFTRFPDAIFVGLSATPIDNKGYLLEGFDHYIDDVQIGDLIKMRWLLPPVYLSPIELDLSKVHISSYGDYEESELEGVVIQEYLIKTAVDNYVKHGENRPFIGFTVSKKHCKAVYQAFNGAGIPVAYLDSDTPDDERKKIDQDFLTGNVKGIISIDILTTGADYPHCACIVDMAPTKVLRKYLQKGGRPMRLLGDSFDESLFNWKIDFIYLDLAGQVKEHGLLEDRRKFKFKPKFSAVIDRFMKIDEVENLEERKSLEIKIDKEKFVKLKKIGKLLDLYDDKVYHTENALMDDIKSFLQKTDLFWYRQNSGVAQYGFALQAELRKFSYDNRLNEMVVSEISKFINYIKGDGKRFVRFTSVSGLSDFSLFFSMGSLFFGIEAKLPSGRLTPHQRQTIPEMLDKNILLFFAHSVFDVYEIICHIENNVQETTNGDILISGSIYDYPERQKRLFDKYGLNLPRKQNAGEN